MFQNQNLKLIHQTTSSDAWTTGISIATAVAALAYSLKHHAPTEHGKAEKPKFTDENITASFVAAIPTITRELNLEVATSTQTETFTQSSGKTVLWGLLDLGTSTVQIRVPVTYRYQIRLHELWELKIKGDTVMVNAPALRASLPPAIHTDQIERLSIRGWCRESPTELMQELERQITPILSECATNPKQLDQVRHACRLSIAEFVKLWLTREGHPFKSIQVKLADEPTLLE